MKKKLLSLALVLVMALTLLPTAAFATDEPDGEENGTPSVTDCTGQEDCTAGTHNAGCLSQKKDPVDPPSDEGTPDQNVVKKDIDANDGTGDGSTTGGADPDDHSARTEVQAEAASCTTAGKKQHWKCTKCELLFDAATNGNQVTAESLVVPKLAHTYVAGVCSVCGAKDSNYTPPIQVGKHSLTLVPEKPATCTTPGNKPYYTCSNCSDLFSDDTAMYTIQKSQTVIAATGHKAPSTGIGQYSAQHRYTCDNPTCPVKIIYENHNFVSNTCSVCGRVRETNPGSYVSIYSLRLYNYSIYVSWTSNADSGTAFDLYLDGSFYGTVHPSKSGGYFSYTMDFSRYLGDPYYNVEVRLSSDSSVRDDETVRNRYDYDYDYDYDYWYDHRYPNGTPGTNSYGIPHASQVNGRYSASEAIRILRNKNQNSLQNDLMSNSSALDSYERLERAVKDANHVSVNVSTDRGVPSAIRAGGGVQITGAAFNASSTNSTVRLVVGTPSVSRYVGRGYQFSMSLTGVGNDSSLDVPVVVSMPLPSDISASYVKVLHYHNSNVPTVITPKVSGSRISFPLTGFSDFVVTDSGVPNYTYVSDGYGGYYVPVGNVPRQSLLEQHVAIVAPILASMPPSGYVFDDVAPGHWAAAAIRWARDGGMMSGYYDGTFRPYAATTRQELWMVLARLAGARPADMEAARIWAVNAGISDGRNPYSPLSRQQMISMLYRYAQYLGRDISGQVPLRNYRDNAAVSGYARNAMAWALDQGILTSDADGFLFPQNIATRADFAVYLYRFVN